MPWLNRWQSLHSFLWWATPHRRKCYCSHFMSHEVFPGGITKQGSVPTQPHVASNMSVFDAEQSMHLAGVTSKNVAENQTPHSLPSPVNGPSLKRLLTGYDTQRANYLLQGFTDSSYNRLACSTIKQLRIWVNNWTGHYNRISSRPYCWPFR